MSHSQNRLGPGIFALSVAAVAGIAILSSPAVLAKNGGIPGHSGNPNQQPSCSTSGCHSSTTALPPEVNFFGPRLVKAGDTVRYTFLLSNIVGSTVGVDPTHAGLGVSLTDGTGVPVGTFLAVDPRTRIGNGPNGEIDIVHARDFPAGTNGATPAVNQQVDYFYDWRAPATVGVFTMYGGGVSAVRSVPSPNPGDDGVALSQMQVEVVAANTCLVSMERVGGLGTRTSTGQQLHLRGTDDVCNGRAALDFVGGPATAPGSVGMLLISDAAGNTPFLDGGVFVDVTSAVLKIVPIRLDSAGSLNIPLRFDATPLSGTTLFVQGLVNDPGDGSMVISNALKIDIG